MTATLLVVDVLNDFVEQHPPEKQAALIAAINRLSDIVRSAHGRIIWVRQAFAPDLGDAFLAMRRSGRGITIEGTRGSQLADGLNVAPDEAVVVKKRYSAFHRTELDRLLPSPEQGDLIVCGLNTHACVRMAVIDAYQRDYHVTIATDATMSYDEEQHVSSLRYLGRSIARLMTNDSIAAEIAAG